MEDVGICNYIFVYWILMAFEGNYPYFSGEELIEFETPQPQMSDEMKSIFEQQLNTPQTNFDILLNKYLNNDQITDNQLQQLSEAERFAIMQLQDKSKAKKKRPDECHKLFYKRAFKFSQKKFFKRAKNKSRKMCQFYHHHFDQAAFQSKMDITEFYHPNKKTRPGLTCGQKTFNLSYVRLILRSRSFKADAREYHKIFLDQCMKEREKKFLSFKGALNKSISGKEGDNQKLLRYLQSSQCKIPWTSKEILEAWEIAQRELDENENEESEQFSKERMKSDTQSGHLG